VRIGPGHRTWLAAVLVSAAVIPPAVGWYVSGSRDARLRAHALRTDTLLAAERRVDDASRRLATRLETLRAREDERPFYHYRNLTHDPRGAGAGWAVMRSPLAMGWTDPLVWAHFEVGTDGEVHLPTVNEQFPELSSDAGFDGFCRLLDELRTGLVVSTPGDEPGGDLRSLPATPASDPTSDRILVLERGAWEQIRQAESLYASGGGRLPDSGRVTIRIGPMRWRTIVLASGPALASLRRVITPDGPIVQGFVVEPGAADDWIGPEARFEPESGLQADRVGSPVGDTGWLVSADASTEIAAAVTDGDRLVRDFRRRFAVVAAALGLLAVAVVALVAQADRLARQRARFAAAAAHELRTPLASVRLHAEMLEEAVPPGGRPREWAARLSSESARLGRQVANMLDLSRVERGAALVNPRPVDVVDAITACLERLRPTLARAGLEVRFESDADLPTVIVDTDALCQILDNLLDNAERYTRGPHHRLVDLTLAATDDGVRLRLRDSGPGVPPRLRRHLFQPFRRADGDGTGGLGLGLAISRALARAMGGELELADDAPGATFLLTLRAAR